jgi:predicted O-linked N-acetylglucosamine transferase (SPINDLY family)
MLPPTNRPASLLFSLFLVSTGPLSNSALQPGNAPVSPEEEAQSEMARGVALMGTSFDMNKQAVKHFSRAAALTPQEFWPQNNICFCLQHDIRRRAEALVHCMKGLELFEAFRGKGQGFPSGAFTIAIKLQIAMDRVEEAETLLERAGRWGAGIAEEVESAAAHLRQAVFLHTVPSATFFVNDPWHASEHQLIYQKLASDGSKRAYLHRNGRQLLKYTSGVEAAQDCWLLARLGRPHFPEIYAYSHQEGASVSMCAMEFFTDTVTVHSLHQNATGIRLDLLQDLTRDAIDILEALQREKISHRDIMPHNVLVRTRADGHRELKLIDFAWGVHDILQPLNWSLPATPENLGIPKSLGGPWYRAPEGYCDVHSMGKVLETAAAGYVGDEDTTAVLQTIAAMTRPSATRVTDPVALRQILLQPGNAQVDTAAPDTELHLVILWQQHDDLYEDLRQSLHIERVVLNDALADADRARVMTQFYQTSLNLAGHGQNVVNDSRGSKAFFVVQVQVPAEYSRRVHSSGRVETVNRAVFDFKSRWRKKLPQGHLFIHATDDQAEVVDNIRYFNIQANLDPDEPRPVFSSTLGIFTALRSANVSYVVLREQCWPGPRPVCITTGSNPIVDTRSAWVLLVPDAAHFQSVVGGIPGAPLWDNTRQKLSVRVNGSEILFELHRVFFGAHVDAAILRERVPVRGGWFALSASHLLFATLHRILVEKQEVVERVDPLKYLAKYIEPRMDEQLMRLCQEAGLSDLNGLSTHDPDGFMQNARRLLLDYTFDLHGDGTSTQEADSVTTPLHLRLSQHPAFARTINRVVAGDFEPNPDYELVFVLVRVVTFGMGISESKDRKLLFALPLVILNCVAGISTNRTKSAAGAQKYFDAASALGKRDFHNVMCYLLQNRPGIAEDMQMHCKATYQDFGSIDSIAVNGRCILAKKQCDYGQYEEGLFILSEGLDLLGGPPYTAEQQPFFVTMAAAKSTTLHAMGRTKEMRELRRMLFEMTDDMDHLIRMCSLPHLLTLESRGLMDAARGTLLSDLQELLRRNVSLSTRDVAMLSNRMLITYALKYHGRNNKELMQRSQNFLQLALAAVLPQPAQPAQSVVRLSLDRLYGKVRVAFVSHFSFERYLSATGAMLRGVIDRLDPAVFEVVVLILSGGEPLPRSLNAQVHLAELLPNDLLSASQAIQRVRPDILVYVETNLVPVINFLAMTRLAPVQVTTLSNPMTSGIHTIDYFVSFSAYEPPNAQEHYTETLVALEGVGGYFPPLSQKHMAMLTMANARFPFDEYGLPIVHRPYLCTQRTEKLHPSFLSMVVGLLRLSASAHVFFVSADKDPVVENWIAVHGRDVHDRMHLLPRLNNFEYKAILRGGIVLDTFPTGGFVTTLDALSMGAPIVTLPGDVMNARNTFGLYKFMNETRCVAKDINHYLLIALELRSASSPLFSEVEKNIRARRHVLFEDETTVESWSDFLLSSVWKAANAHSQPNRSCERTARDGRCGVAAGMGLDAAAGREFGRRIKAAAQGPRSGP